MLVSWRPYQGWWTLTHLPRAAFLASSSSWLLTLQRAELSGTRRGKTEDLPSQASPVSLGETDKKVIVTNAIRVPAGGFCAWPQPRAFSPPQTSLPTEPLAQVQGEEGTVCAALPALLPPRGNHRAPPRGRRSRESLSLRRQGERGAPARRRWRGRARPLRPCAAELRGMRTGKRGRA